MNILAIIQARIKSHRLPRKMLLPLNGHCIIWHAWNTAKEVFDHVVIACPAADRAEFEDALPGARVFGWDGDEDDVLGRFHACAYHYFPNGGLPHSIVRITPDDFPIDVTRERFTLAQLDHWHKTVTTPNFREHMGLLMPERIEINTEADYELAKVIASRVQPN